MKEAVVEQKVETYFRDRFPQFSVSPQCQVRFGTRKGGIADVVLHQPVGEENGYFVAIAECKKRPLPVNRFYARAQLKSYLSATPISVIRSFLIIHDMGCSPLVQIRETGSFVRINLITGSCRSSKTLLKRVLITGSLSRLIP